MTAAHALASAPTDTRPRLEVDLTAVAANTEHLARAATKGLMAVVKADGFGHGAAAVARTALTHGANSLGVATLAEAVALREEGITAPVLCWLNPVASDWELALRHRIDVAVPGVAHLDAIAAVAACTGVPARVHLHADTGMARDGAPAPQWVGLAERARRLERGGSVRVVGAMGHLALAAGGPDLPGRAAFTRFHRLVRRTGLRPQVRHLAATAATLADPATHYELCRVGAGLVGIDPGGTTALRGAVRLTAPVVSVRDVRAGTGVGYGHTWTAPHRTRLALVPLGYGDGIPPAAVPGAEVLLAGRRLPLVGAVSMDGVVVDVGDAPVRAGDVAVVLGPGDHGEPTLAEWARWGRTLPHAVLTGLGGRAVRHVVTAPTLRSAR